jgi:hypothetical protein
VEHSTDFYIDKSRARSVDDEAALVFENAFQAFE